MKDPAFLRLVGVTRGTARAPGQRGEPSTYDLRALFVLMWANRRGEDIGQPWHADASANLRLVAAELASAHPHTSAWVLFHADRPDWQQGIQTLVRRKPVPEVAQDYVAFYEGAA